MELHALVGNLVLEFRCPEGLVKQKTKTGHEQTYTKFIRG